MKSDEQFAIIVSEREIKTMTSQIIFAIVAVVFVVSALVQLKSASSIKSARKSFDDQDNVDSSFTTARVANISQAQAFTFKGGK